MRVDHCRADIRVTEQLLRRANVPPRFKQMRDEAVAERMTISRLTMLALRIASFTAFCKTEGAGWWRRSTFDRGSIERFGAGKTYCHFLSVAAMLMIDCVGNGAGLYSAPSQTQAVTNHSQIFLDSQEWRLCKLGGR
jgi:hypothetical protein